MNPDAHAENSETPANTLPANVKLLGWVSLLNDTASEMIYPLIPEFLTKTLKATTTHLGIMEGVSESVSSLLKLFSGGWSDRAGSRKRFVVVGYLLAALTRPLCALANGPWQLFSIRVADRIGKGIRSAPRDAMIADCTDESNRGRAFGFHRAMDHVGAILGPALATIFLWFFPEQFRWLFALAIIPGLLVFLLVAFFLRDRPVPRVPSEHTTLTLKPFDSRFRWYLLSLFVFTLGNSSDMFLLKRAGEVGVTVVWLPVLWGVFHIVKSVGNVLSGRLVDRIGSRPLILFGWFVYAVIYVLFAFVTAAWQIWVLFLGYGVFYALTEPAEKALVAQLVGSERKGLAYGWFNLTIGIGALPANILFGFLYHYFGDHGPLVAFGVGAVFALIASVMLLTLVSKHPR